MRIYAATETFSAALKRKKSVGGGEGRREERKKKERRKGIWRKRQLFRQMILRRTSDFMRTKGKIRRECIYKKGKRKKRNKNLFILVGTL